MAGERKTLKQFLAGSRMQEAASSPELEKLLLNLAQLFKSMDHRGGVAGGTPGEKPVLPAGWVGGGGEDDCGPRPCSMRSGRYLVALLPVGASDVDANTTRGTIFSVLLADNPASDAIAGDFLQRGSRQVCAGYAIYGPSIVLVLALGAHVQAFTLDERRDLFVLTHADIRIAEATDEIAIDVSNMRFWTPAIRRYVDECIAGAPGPRGKDFRFHWLESIVAETHRVLLRGGIFVCPASGAAPVPEALPRLLHEANPISFIVERAGGRACTGTTRILDVEPGDLDRRVPLIFGAAEEVERIETYHADVEAGRYDAPLFGERGLFRATI